MSIYYRLVKTAGRRRWFARVAAPIAASLDRIVYKVSGGRRMATPSGFPSLMLSATGRRSNEVRTTPLLYVAADDGYVVVGTNWGRSDTPDWVLNLVHNPHAEVEVDGERFAIVAHELEEAAQAQWWPRFEAMWPAYSAYRSRIRTRRIRMFLLSVE